MLEITLPLVTSLIVQQFPQWAHLSIRPVELSGWDNRTFRLGEEMLIRLPSSEGYALQVQKEQKWLPRLAGQLSLSIPAPIAMGQPSDFYPWSWSVYQWIEGKSANILPINSFDLALIALQLARFLVELHTIDITDAPPPGIHNYHRGGQLSVYDAETRSYILELKNIIDVKKATALWEKAISYSWNKSPVWVHGDFASGNIIVKENKLTAIIDFGCMGIGDPACDLVIAWTFLKGKSRKVFRKHINLDIDTWARARGWALWKACYELVSFKDRGDLEAIKRHKVINEILGEDEFESK